MCLTYGTVKIELCIRDWEIIYDMFYLVTMGECFSAKETTEELNYKDALCKCRFLLVQIESVENGMHRLRNMLALDAAILFSILRVGNRITVKFYFGDLMKPVKGSCEKDFT